MPGLAERREDIEPNLSYELERYASLHGEQIRFNVEARQRYLKFAESFDASWRGNFRELSASVTRMATLAESGRITEAVAAEEIARLQKDWQQNTQEDVVTELLGAEAAAALDLFDRMQLQSVISICRQSASLSDAGRKLFAMSRQQKVKSNDADRLRKYLTKFGLDWDSICPPR